MGGGVNGESRVICVTNIAPQATRDQMQTLFSYIGRIEDIRLYPSVRDASLSISSRVCFVKFSDCSAASVGTHLNNTVFIDRAIIVTPVRNGTIPDEVEGLEMSSRSSSSKYSESKFPPNITNSYQGNLVFTGDTCLDAAGLPGYPPMPASTATEILEELRRTVTVSYLDPTVSAQQCMEFFSKEAGEVKYFRYATRENDPIKYALIEFTEQSSIVPALLMNDRTLGSCRIKVTHATSSIIKPTAKSNEAAQKEIEEALTRVKEAQSLVAATVDPLMGMLGCNTNTITGSGLTSALVRTSRSRTRSRSRRRSRSRGRSSYSSRRSRSRSRHRRRSRSRSRDRRRKRSRSRRRRTRSRDRRSRSRDKRSRSKERNGHDDKKKSKSRSKSRDRKVRSKSRERKRSRSRSRGGERSSKRSRSRSRKRSRSRSRDRRRRSRSRRRKSSRSRERRRRSREKKSSRKSRSRSRAKKEKRRSRSKDKSESTTNGSSKKENRISRDYDQEEIGFEKTNDDYSREEHKSSKHDKEETLGTQDMEISNSP